MPRTRRPSTTYAYTLTSLIRPHSTRYYGATDTTIGAAFDRVRNALGAAPAGVMATCRIRGVGAAHYIVITEHAR